jgi:energy-converting hydrogenase Eha subunit A
MDLQLLQTIAIIALVSFILGIIVGAALTRPRMVQRRPSRKWEE